MAESVVFSLYCKPIDIILETFHWVDDTYGHVHGALYLSLFHFLAAVVAFNWVAFVHEYVNGVLRRLGFFFFLS